MAKFTFYIDIYPGLDINQYGLMATTNPGRKSEGSKRIAFDVTIEDETINDIDAHAAAVSKPKQVDV